MVYMKMIIHSIKRKLSDYKMLFMLTVFPICLTAMFAFVFEQAFAPTFGEAKVEGHIVVVVEEAGTELGENYLAFLEGLDEEQIQMKYERITQEEVESIEEEEKVDAIIFIDEAKDAISMKSLSKKAQVDSAIGSLNEGYAQSVALQAVIEEQLREGKIIEIPEVRKDEIVTAHLIKDGTSQSVVTNMILAMFIFAILIGGQLGIEQVFYLNESVGKRIYTAPVRRIGVYLTEMIACWATIFLVSSIVAGVFEAMFQIGFSQDVGGMIVIIGVTALMSTLLGTAVGMIVPSPAAGESLYGFLQTGIVILSGTLVPGADFGKLTYLTPVKGIIGGLQEIISEGRIESMGSIVVGLVVIIGIVSMMGIVFKRREA